MALDPKSKVASEYLLWDMSHLSFSSCLWRGWGLVLRGFFLRPGRWQTCLLYLLFPERSRAHFAQVNALQGYCPMSSYSGTGVELSPASPVASSQWGLDGHHCPVLLQERKWGPQRLRLGWRSWACQGLVWDLWVPLPWPTGSDPAWRPLPSEVHTAARWASGFLFAVHMLALVRQGPCWFTGSGPWSRRVSRLGCPEHGWGCGSYCAWGAAPDLGSWDWQLCCGKQRRERKTEPCSAASWVTLGKSIDLSEPQTIIGNSDSCFAGCWEKWCASCFWGWEGKGGSYGLLEAGVNKKSRGNSLLPSPFVFPSLSFYLFACEWIHTKPSGRICRKLTTVVTKSGESFRVGWMEQNQRTNCSGVGDFCYTFIFSLSLGFESCKYVSCLKN